MRSKRLSKTSKAIRGDDDLKQMTYDFNKVFSLVKQKEPVERDTEATDKKAK